MEKPVIVLVGSSTPIQKLLPRVLEADRIQVAAVYGDLSSDEATQQTCEAAQIPFHDMGALKGSKGPAHLETFRPDWVFNINSMVLFKEALLQVPRKGALNLHCGNLPEYAGKHAHQWAIRRGATEFGVTLHWMTVHIDGGDIAGIRYFPITARDTGLSLYMKYIKEGIPLVEEILAQIAEGKEVPRQTQDLSQRRYFLDREAQDGNIPWHLSQAEVLNFFRAADYAPFKSPTYTPTSYYGKEPVTMSKAKASEGEMNVPGKILAQEEKGWLIGTGTAPVLIRRIHHSEPIQVGSHFTQEENANG